MKDLIKYRIETKDHKFKFAGTGLNSWFTLSEAKLLCNRIKGERVVECNGYGILWEVL